MSFSEGQKFLNSLPEITVHLPVSPQLFQQIFSATAEHSTLSMDALGRIVEQDQGLAVKMLGMANSAYYGLQSQVTTVRRAVVVLGLKEIRKLLLLMSIRGLESGLKPGVFDVNTHWRHQVEVAHAAQALARQSTTFDPDEIFTLGLLHDLGKLITALFRPERWLAVQALARQKEIPLYQAEDLHWGLDHALIGAMTLKTWFFPTSLTEPINWHHNPDLSSGYSGQAALLRLADALSHMHAAQTELPEHSAWKQELESLVTGRQVLMSAAHEVLQSGAPAAFLHGLGIPQTTLH